MRRCTPTLLINRVGLVGHEADAGGPASEVRTAMWEPSPAAATNRHPSSWNVASCSTPCAAASSALSGDHAEHE